jgi:hypothetical protein
MDMRDRQEWSSDVGVDLVSIRVAKGREQVDDGN